MHLFAVAFQLFCLELTDEVKVFFHFSFCVVHIHQSQLAEQFGSLCRVLNDEVRHDTYRSHLIEATCHEVQQFLILCLFHRIGAGFELVGHLFDAVHQRLHFFAARHLLVVAQGGRV